MSNTPRSVRGEALDWDLLKRCTTEDEVKEWFEENGGQWSL